MFQITCLLVSIPVRVIIRFLRKRLYNSSQIWNVLQNKKWNIKIRYSNQLPQKKNYANLARANYGIGDCYTIRAILHNWIVRVF
jgi:hypothetical protein